MSNKKHEKQVQLWMIPITAVIFAAVLLALPHSVPWTARVALAVTVNAILLWALELIPYGLTAVLTGFLLLVLQAAPTSVVFSGFASPALFLVVAGMMIATAVNETPLAKRITYHILSIIGGSATGIVLALIMILQIQAFFIPATAVRATLLLPVALSLVQLMNAAPGSNLRRLLLLAVAFGGNISGTAVMTAAIGNIITVELINTTLGYKISYLQWFVYTLPLWLALTPIIWFILIKTYPPETRHFPHLGAEMRKKLAELGPMQSAEKRCMTMMGLTVLVWMLEPFHGLHPTATAVMAVVLLTMPGIGVVSFDKVVQINFSTILILGFTLSLGNALNQSGAITFLGTLVSASWILQVLQQPLLAITFVVVVTQVYHLGVTNVGTTVVTILPIITGLAVAAGVNPVPLAFTAGLTSLFGYILIVETLPNVVVHSTGLISQQEFLLPGLWATIATTVLTILVAATWWRWLGFI